MMEHWEETQTRAHTVELHFLLFAGEHIMIITKIDVCEHLATECSAVSASILYGLILHFDGVQLAKC